MAKTLTFDEFLEDQEPKANARQKFNAQQGLRGRDAPPGDPEGVFKGVNIDRRETVNPRVLSGVPSFAQDEINRDLAIAKANRGNDNFRPGFVPSDTAMADDGKTLSFDDVEKIKKYDVGSGFIDDVGNFLHGARKGVVDVGLGMKQRLDEGANYLESKFGGESISRALPFGGTAKEALNQTNEEIAARRNYYEPLMKTKSGIAGNVTGSVVSAAPAAFVPGAATIPGSIAIGAGQGYLSPTIEGESPGKNAAIGGLLGAVVPGAVSAFRGVKGLLYDPFAKSSIEKAAANTLREYGVTANSLKNVSSSPTITGARPMLPEQLDDPLAMAGAARLRDNLKQLPQQQPRFASREMQNNESRVDKLYDLAGTGGKRDAAEMARAKEAKLNYDDAFKTPFSIEKFPQKLKTDYINLMSKLDESGAIRIAQKEAALRGSNFNLENDIQSLHLTKEALDSLLTKAEAQGAPMVGLSKTKNELVAFLKNVSKKYENARGEFAISSTPINQMDVAQTIIDKGTKPAFASLSDRQILPASMTRLMDNEPGLIRASTKGKSPETSLKGLLDQNQYDQLTSIRNEVGREAEVMRLGAGYGSPTAQRGEGLKSLGKVAGSFGLLNPAGLVAQGVNYVRGKVIEPRIQAALTEIMLNPGKANAVMSSLSPKQQTALKQAMDNQLLQQTIRQSLPALYASERQ